MGLSYVSQWNEPEKNVLYVNTTMETTTMETELPDCVVQMIPNLRYEFQGDVWLDYEGILDEFIHKLVEANKMRVEYAPTLTRRGEGFMKCFIPAKFLAARDTMSLVSTAQPASTSAQPTLQK